eukprot:CAMPEP_0205830186 /NCGR_PEP_ID=MMETSP0206-20130828/40318_1 /ASSEMBLY_ACC=CAM_ASM_000279 /TAXON_ID=36767 /ORGANISM="Euplotes focardii, Strain TN1" /LENGTH=270 /DNA_ID=CAMNT_0053133593 /DNA_START=684 /DNA_END=1496 /DNA_ORIENTATION=-
MFPLLNKYNFLNPFKDYMKNLKSFKSGVAEMMRGCKDPESLNYKLTNNSSCSFEENLDDLAIAMFAGTETAAHSMASFFYYLKKNEKVYKKLEKELKDNGFTKGDNFKEHVTLKNIQNLNYLSCCTKEVLRMDSPSLDTADYLVKENVDICNVPIPKDTILKIDICSGHFNNNSWMNPLEFIPERHDTDSDFYKKAKDAGIIPDTYSRRSFSHGMRNCPGMSLAMLELKVFIIYFITHIEYEFDLDMLNLEGVGFGMGSHFEPKIKVKKI